MNQFGIALRESDRRVYRDTPPDGSGTVVDLDRLLAGLRRQRWIYACWIVLMSILAIAITVTTPPSFRATATLMMVDEARLETVSANGIQAVPATDKIQTAEQIFRSRALALQVSDRLALDENVRFMEQPVATTTVVIEGAMAAARGVVDSAVALVTPTQDVSAGPPPSESEMAMARRQDAARSLQSGINVRQLGRSTALEIAFNLYDPVLASEIVNTYTDAYMTDQMNAEFERSALTTEWLQQRLDQLEAESRQAATDVQQFRIENDLVTVRNALVSEGNVDRFNIELSTALTEAARIRARVRAYEAALAEAPEMLAEQDALRLSLPGDTQLDALRETLNSLRARRGEIVRDFGPEHPQVQAVERRIGDAARRLHAEMERQLEVLRGELEVAETQVLSLQQALDPVVATNTDAARASVELRLLEQRADSLGRLHEAFLVELQQAGQLASFPAANLRILTAADVPVDPVSPSKRRAVLLAIILGFLFGTVHAVWREWRDQSVRTGRDVIERLGQPFLGNLPTLNQSDRLTLSGVGARKGRATRPDEIVRALHHRPRPTSDAIGMPVVDVPLASLADPHSPYCETLRRVRNAVHRTGSGQAGRVLGITSLLSGEGKTYIGTDLADILSLQCGPTLLVDCDLRRLSLSQSVGIKNGVSIKNVLDGTVDWRQSLVRLAGSEVDVLGWDQTTAVGEPSDLLGSDQMLRLIKDAATQYRTVVLDLAAIYPTVDVKELLPVIDQIVLLAEWGGTSITALQRVLKAEPELQERMIGIVLNKVNLRQLRNYDEPGVNEYLKVYGS